MFGYPLTPVCQYPKLQFVNNLNPKWLCTKYQKWQCVAPMSCIVTSKFKVTARLTLVTSSVLFNRQFESMFYEINLSHTF